MLSELLLWRVPPSPRPNQPFPLALTLIVAQPTLPDRNLGYAGWIRSVGWLAVLKGGRDWDASQVCALSSVGLEFLVSVGSVFRASPGTLGTHHQLGLRRLPTR